MFSSPLQVIGPFDNVRQSAFYLPWAVLQEQGPEAALPCQQRYNMFLDSVKRFDAQLQAASRFSATEADVQAAFDSMQACLAAVLSAVSLPTAT